MSAAAESMPRETRRRARLPASGSAALVVVILLWLAALVSPIFARRAAEIRLEERLAAPSATHPFGTDDLGRDLFARVMVATPVSLGIAEGAHEHASGEILAKGLRSDGRTRMLAAENIVELAACRATLGRVGALVDDHFASGSAGDAALLFAEAQAAKTFVGEAAVRVVDRALALSGGAGYLNGSPLARAYRDVRATAFMHPLGANRAYDYLGELALGGRPSLN